MAKSRQEAPVTIEFRKSRSPYFRQLLRVIKRSGPYELVQDAKGELHRSIIEDKRTLLDMEYIIERLSGWQHARILYKGQVVPFEQAIAIIKCAVFRDKPHHAPWPCTPEKLIYARDPLPYWCDKIEVGVRAWSDTNWWDYGELDEQGVLRVDKAAIRSVLARSSETRHLSLCPYFDCERAMAAINALPDEIDPTSDKEWIYLTALQNGAEQIVGVYPPVPNTPDRAIAEAITEAREQVTETRDTINEFLDGVRKDWKDGQA